MKFHFDFATLAASMTVRDARTESASRPAGSHVVLTRGAGYFYVYTWQELLKKLQQAAATDSLDAALELQEPKTVWAVTLKAGKAPHVPNHWAPPKPYAVVVTGESDLRAVVKVKNPSPKADTFARMVSESFAKEMNKYVRVTTSDALEVSDASDALGVSIPGAASPSTASSGLIRPAASMPEFGKRKMRSVKPAAARMEGTKAKASVAAPPLGAAQGEGTEITRWPTVEPQAPAIPGGELPLQVDLTPERAPTSSAGPVKFDFKEDWTEEKVGVQLTSPFLRFGEDKGSGEIVVRRDKKSVPCVLSARVLEAAEKESMLEVIATFSYQGRFCGSCRTMIPITAPSARAAAVAGGEKTPSAAAPAPRAEQSIGEVVISKVAAPDLTVHIQYYKTGTSHLYSWTLDPRERWEWLPPQLSDFVPLQSDPSSELRAMLEAVTPMTTGHEEFLSGMGMRIYDSTPECFKKVYWAMREKRGKEFPIQFVTNDSSVPWELMSPYKEDSGEEEELLFLAHPVARWLSKYEGTMPAKLPAGDIVTIAPEYTKRSETGEIPQLLIAVEVSNELRTDAAYHAQHVNGDFRSLLDLLEGNDESHVALLHVGGHGKFIALAADASVLYLDDADLHPAQVRTLRVKLGERCKTMVILNACQLGEVGPMMESVGGWADAFLSRKFSGFIAPLWSVYDEDAGTFSTELLKRIWTSPRKPISTALCEIRNKFGRRSASFFAYVYYGDVMARFEP